ncbi:hypothetical protein AGLY_002770 [Aphis glycines]|uniref:Uncharacterized protein n=1 Tax=Aphis glycines TaxID=307491 RepID=A0A6G0U2K4_APHGL|nr:hypothetical protein AGLY_002770 [Aphis glycines]
MENQKLLDIETEVTENDQKTIFSVTDDRAVSEELKHKYENVIDDDLSILTEKVINAEKSPPIENTYEVIDQESKTVHDVQEEAEDTNKSDEEKDNLFEDDKVNHKKNEEFRTLPQVESPKVEELVSSEKPESMITDITKTVIIQENEPVDTVQSKVKVTDIPEVIPKVSTKKDSDEGDVCDIKIGPDELFCRIGLVFCALSINGLTLRNYHQKATRAAAAASIVGGSHSPPPKLRAVASARYFVDGSSAGFFRLFVLPPTPSAPYPAASSLVLLIAFAANNVVLLLLLLSYYNRTQAGLLSVVSFYCVAIRKARYYIVAQRVSVLLLFSSSSVIVIFPRVRSPVRFLPPS